MLLQCLARPMSTLKRSVVRRWVPVLSKPMFSTSENRKYHTQVVSGHDVVHPHVAGVQGPGEFHLQHGTKSSPSLARRCWKAVSADTLSKSSMRRGTSSSCVSSSRNPSRNSAVPGRRRPGRPIPVASVGCSRTLRRCVDRRRSAPEPSLMKPRKPCDDDVVLDGYDAAEAIEERHFPLEPVIDLAVVLPFDDFHGPEAPDGAPVAATSATRCSSPGRGASEKRKRSLSAASGFALGDRLCAAGDEGGRRANADGT